MTIAFPRVMPSDGARVESLVFEPDFMLADNPEAGGGDASVGLALPRWVGEWATTNLVEPHTSEWRAWLDTMKRPGACFYAFDASKPQPRAYPAGVTGLTRAGGGAFDGTSASWSVDSSRTVLTINTLPAGFVVSLSDPVGFVWSTTKRALARVVEAGVANGSGVWTGEVTPPLPAWVPGGAVVNLVKPTCVMRVLRDTIVKPRVTAGNRARTGFAARETPGWSAT